MAAGDATWNPKKGVAYRVTFPILDADGDLVTGATGLDSEVSKDAGTFTDCTNEATEIATSSGVYYLDLTATEMNADTVAVIVKTSSSGAKTTVLVMYPLETADTPVDVLAISGDSVAADNLEAAADGTGYNLGGGSIVAASVTAAVTANTTQLAGQTVTAAAGVTFPGTVSSLTAAGVRTELATELGRIDVATSTRLASSAYTTPPTVGAIADAVWDETLGDHLASGSTGAGLNAAGSAGDPWSTSLPGAYGSGTAGYILGTNLNATVSSRLATSGYTAPLDAAGTRSALGLATANLDTQLGDLPTATENAAAVWNAAIATYTASGSFGQRVLRSTNTQAEVAITGSNHVAADIHELQPAVIDNTHFAAGAIDSNALAASAATEIATATLGATVEGSETLVQAVRLVRAALVGKLSGAATTTVTIRDAADSKARITATVDADGNRLSVSTDAT